MSPSAIQPSGPGAIIPTDRSHIVDDNVWEWTHSIAEASPIQPPSNLGTGFNEYNPPDFVISEHAKALQYVEGNQYAPVPGTAVLKDAIAEIYSPLYGRQLDAKTEILITSGAQEGLLSCVLSFIDRGDEVILLEPVFALYVYQIKFAGGVIKYVPLRPPPNADNKTVSGNDWTIDLDELEAAITPRTKMIYFNNPQNPLGKVFNREELRGIGDLCVRLNLILISDEVYERIAFENTPNCANPTPHIRVASLSPEIAAQTLTAVSMGKLFNATGWRVGFVIGGETLMKPVFGTHLVAAYSSSTPAQVACANGLRIAEKTNWWAENSRDVARRCKALCDVLDEVGLTYVAPAGAWFVFVNISRVQIPEDYTYHSIVNQNGSRDWKVCYWLVQEFGISSIPGSAFYCPENAHLGENYLRFGACKSDDGLALARERLLKLKPHIAGTS